MYCYAHTVGFESLRWGVFEWRYEGMAQRKTYVESNDGGKVDHFLILEK